jgi:hypothetical protein
MSNSATPNVRCNLMFGLKHVPVERRADEAVVLLLELAEQIKQKGSLIAGDTIVLYAGDGTRVGVFDAFKDWTEA